jgi:hypothetical protein
MLETLLVELNAFYEKTFDELKLLNAVLRPEVPAFVSRASSQS